jgi:phthiocerol/phenolphthiocerol synthesis type-I polyketide synthase E
MDNPEILEGVALVAMACRFPGAPNIAEFWHILRDGIETVSFFSAEELEQAGVPRSVSMAPGYVRAAPVLDDVECFDAPFFGFSPREAELLDPQHRLFLECAWEAVENAGYDPDRFAGRIAVFAGSALNNYTRRYVYLGEEVWQAVDPLQFLTAIDKDFLPTQTSFKLNLRGPSVGIQTACSTGLVAVHLAAQSLLTYQCDLALAGAVTVRVPQKTGYQHRQGSIESADGHCRAFDAHASGTIFGSGLGVVMLKRLQEAMVDGDTISAVIKGSAINNDGALKVGYTAPSVRGQAEVIATAQAIAESDPERISYIETHGTGTALGDPVEIAALHEVFRPRTKRRRFCALGSVKTNIGHLDTAAGIAGLIKAALALEHRQIPASLHFEQPNPQIDFADSPFYINTRLAEWPADGGPRRAGVSSFGVGGTNAHVILEEAPETAPGSPSRLWQLLLLSARTGSALEAVTTRLAEHLRQNPAIDLADVAHTLQVGRKSFDHRRMVVCREREDAIAALSGQEPKRLLTAFQEPGDRPVAFLFPGQGAQHTGMARELLATEPVFRHELEICTEWLRPHLGLDLCALLASPPTEQDGRDDLLAQTWITQPALFAVEYALARLWISWGVRPAALIGHSVGEYVAACLAETFSLEDALALVTARGRLIQSLPVGAMLSVPLPEAELLPLLEEEGLALAAVNAPSLCVAAGPCEAVERLRERLAMAGLEARRLRTSHAFHSPLMEPILERFAEEVARVRRNPPRIPVVSNVTGTWLTAAEATDPLYWARHLRRPVRFADGLDAVLQEPGRVLLEVGPGRTLTTFANRHPRRAPGHVALPSMRHPHDAQPDAAFLLTALGRLWLAGVEVDWSGYRSGERRRRIPLPTYPFERQRYWIEKSSAGDKVKHRSQRPPLDHWFQIPSWKETMPPRAPHAGSGASGWLVLGGGCLLGEELAGRLRSQGHEVITVASGKGFARLGEGAYALDPGLRSSYEALLRDLAARGRLPERVLHLWTLGDSADSMDQWLERGFYSLIFLAQALGEVKAAPPMRIEVITDGLWRIGRDERPRPEKATLLGPVRVIPREYPHLQCRAIDVVQQPGRAGLVQLVDQLTAELAAPWDEPVVAYRGDQRWVQDVQKVPLANRGAPETRLRPGGVYLITGGLGGIGLTLAEHLSQTVRTPRLVLISRSGLPDRQTWAECLARFGEADPVSRRIRRVQSLEALGAEVLVLRADVTDEAQVREAVAMARRRFGGIHGVIHGAGVPGGGAIQLKTRAAAEAVLAPKVRGTAALAAALADLPLDFFILLSSTLSLTGAVGQVDYCAANAFLDAFAQAHSRPGRLILAINWGLWSDIGMAADAVAALAAPVVASRGDTESGAQTGHSLLGRRSHASDAEEIYSVRLSPAQHWLLGEHKIFGEPVLPGVAYLEMARAAFALHGVGASEIRDALFLEPLRIGLGEEREVQTVLRRDATGFSFTIRSVRGTGGTVQFQEHAVGKLTVPEGHACRRELHRSAQRPPPVEQPATTPRQAPVTWGRHWQEIRTTPLGKGLFHLEMPEDLTDEMGQFPLHPALLDVATSLGVALLGGATYLPLAYKSLKIYAPLPASIYVQVELRSPEGSRHEAAAFDVAILDEEGWELVVVNEFTLRRLVAVAHPVQESKTETAPVAAPGDAAARGRDLLAQGMSSEEGVEAFARVLSHVTVPQIVVTPGDLRATFSRSGEGILRSAAPGPEPPMHRQRGLQTPYAAPRNEVERAIAGLWQQALGFEQVGIHDDFFELGGHSVLAIQLLTRLRETFELDLPLGTLFEAPTVADLAEVVLRSLSEGIDDAELNAALSDLDQLPDDERALSLLHHQPLAERGTDV